MLGEAIRIARSFVGLSQGELAKEMGISSGYLSQIEAGDRELSQAKLRAAAKALQVPTSALVFFSEQLEHGEEDGERDARARFGRRLLAALAAIEREAE